MLIHKKSPTIAWGLSFVLLLSIVACQRSSLKRRTAVAEDIQMGKNEQIITYKENGRELQIGMGEMFHILLPENPTTGYQWEIHKSGAPFIAFEKDEYSGPESDPVRPLLGRGGARSFAFNAVKLGETHLVLRLRRSWEAESEFADSFSIYLKIADLKK